MAEALPLDAPEPPPADAPAPAPEHASRGREAWAVVLLLVSTALAATVFLTVFSPLFWFPGMILLLASTRWSNRDKWLGFLTYGIGGLIVPALLIFGPWLPWFSARRTECKGAFFDFSGCAPAPSAGVWLVFLVVTALFLFQLYTAYRLWRHSRA